MAFHLVTRVKDSKTLKKGIEEVSWFGWRVPPLPTGKLRSRRQRVTEDAAMENVATGKYFKFGC